MCMADWELTAKFDVVLKGLNKWTLFLAGSAHTADRPQQNGPSNKLSI